MISKSLSRKTLAAFVSVAVLSVTHVALAGAKVAPERFQFPPSDSERVRKLFGGTLFSGSTVVTGNNSTATVSLSRWAALIVAELYLILNSRRERTGMLDKGVAKVSRSQVFRSTCNEDGA